MRDVYRPGYESVLEVPNLTAEQFEQSLREGGIWNEMTELAMKQADIAHSDRFRHSGRPYLEEHVYPVTLEAVQYLRGRGKSLERQQTMACAGLLHDTVEDLPGFEIETCRQMFGGSVSVIVYAVTKYDAMQPVAPGAERKKLRDDIYARKLMNSPNDAQRLKLIDRKNNLKSSLLLIDALPDQLLDYTVETEQIYLPLASRLLDDSFLVALQDLVGRSYAGLEERGQLNEENISVLQAKYALKQ